MNELNNKRTKLPDSQKDLVNLVVKKALEKHKAKVNNNLTSEDKKQIRKIFNKLQNEVNQFLKASGQPELPAVEEIDKDENKAKRTKRGIRLR